MCCKLYQQIAFLSISQKEKVVSNDIKPNKIYSAMANAFKQMPVIGKEKRAQGGGMNYQYRGIDDVYNTVHVVLGENGIFVTTAINNLSRNLECFKGKNGDRYQFVVNAELTVRFNADDGSFVETVVPAEGIDSGDKASAKLVSNGVKAAFLSVFCIPVEEIDGVNLNNEASHDQVIPTLNEDQISEFVETCGKYGLEVEESAKFFINAFNSSGKNYQSLNDIPQAAMPKMIAKLADMAEENAAKQILEFCDAKDNEAMVKCVSSLKGVLPNDNYNRLSLLMDIACDAIAFANGDTDFKSQCAENISNYQKAGGKFLDSTLIKQVMEG